MDEADALSMSPAPSIRFTSAARASRRGCCWQLFRWLSYENPHGVVALWLESASIQRCRHRAVRRA
ncbi:hypothetical protein LNP74_00150 [Klebsiella pneumoniae subsp. pneumoniae]|nr:hypothetical protein [Klebsiella pneumoniae subsp. pneumoniae]